VKKKFIEKARFSIEFRVSYGKNGFLRGIARFATQGEYSVRERYVSFRYKEGVSISADITIATARGELQYPLFRIVGRHPISVSLKKEDIIRPDLELVTNEISSALRGALEKFLSLNESHQLRVLCKGVNKYFLLATLDERDDSKRFDFCIDANAWSRLFGEVSRKPFDGWYVPKVHKPQDSEWDCS
jgi:hypothetical protein